MGTKLEVYERLVDLCMRRDDGEGAASEIFGYIEQAKSRSLRDLFFERVPIAVAAGGPTELVRQIRTLREELNWHYHRVEIEQLRRDEGWAERLAALQARLRRREETFIHVLREMPSDKREAAGLHGTGVASLEEIRTVMRPGMVLIEYFRTADRVIAAVVTENQLEIIPVTTVPRIRQLLGLLQFQLAGSSSCRPNTSGESPVWRCWQRRRIFGSCTPNCSRRWTFLSVVISSSCRTICCTTCLFMRCTTGNGMSSTRTRSPTRPARPSTGSVVGVRLPPQERPSFSVSRTSARPISSKKSRRLQHVADPLLRIDEAATAAALRQLGATSRIIHIATHGYFREDNPLFSGIRLGDSYLTLLRPLQLTAACRAHHRERMRNRTECRDRRRRTGRAHPGPVLCWCCDRCSSRSGTSTTGARQRFVKSFYRSYGAGINKAQSVQNAMVAIREAYPHPYHWAPFMLVGAAS